MQRYDLVPYSQHCHEQSRKNDGWPIPDRPSYAASEELATQVAITDAHAHRKQTRDECTAHIKFLIIYGSVTVLYASLSHEITACVVTSFSAFLLTKPDINSRPKNEAGFDWLFLAVFVAIYERECQNNFARNYHPKVHSIAAEIIQELNINQPQPQRLRCLALVGGMLIDRSIKWTHYQHAIMTNLKDVVSRQYTSNSLHWVSMQPMKQPHETRDVSNLTCRSSSAQGPRSRLSVQPSVVGVGGWTWWWPTPGGWCSCTTEESFSLRRYWLSWCWWVPI